jgi:hypothetical protein
MAFRGAFECAKCPQSSDPAAKRACPAWWETIWNNDRGESRVEKSCAFRQMPELFASMALSANRAAASAQQMRDAAINTMKLTAVKVMNETPYLISDTSLRRAGREPQSGDEIDNRDVSEDRGGIQQPGVRHNG